VTARIIAAVVVLSFGLAGCGSDDKTPDDDLVGKRAMLRSSITLSGALTLKGSYETTYSSATGANCASFAKRTSTTDEPVSFVLPMPTRLSGKHLSWTATIRPYTGPGRYAKAKIPGLSAAVLDDKGEPSERFASSGSTQATAVVEEDGSGTFSFTGLGRAGRVLAGNARWSCTDT
jgi:hypothetical protein